MFDAKKIDELTRNILKILPAGVSNVQRDVEKNLHSVLQAGLAKLDLVTREEFEVQSAVLARTRQKLEDLEMRVAAVEAD